MDLLIADLNRVGVRCAVATTGRPTWVEPLLDRLFGRRTFEVVVTGDDVVELKPAPEVYMRVLEGFGVPASEVLAVEDSPPGLASARVAGLTWMVVTNGYKRAPRRSPVRPQC